MTSRLAAAVTISLLLAAPAAAERLPVTSYTAGDGLLYSVRRIVPDSRGFLWFAVGVGGMHFEGRPLHRSALPRHVRKARIEKVVRLRRQELKHARRCRRRRRDAAGEPKPSTRRAEHRPPG